jgi:hypothetical protein
LRVGTKFVARDVSAMGWVRRDAVNELIDGSRD